MSDIRTDSLGRPLCEGLTKRQSKCSAPALPNSPFCEWHDPSRPPPTSRKVRAIREAWRAQQAASERSEEPPTAQGRPG